MKLFITLGNQLFPLKYLSRFKNDHLFFMAEDYGLCTYEKHHKLKILLFLSSILPRIGCEAISLILFSSDIFLKDS